MSAIVDNSCAAIAIAISAPVTVLFFKYIPFAKRAAPLAIAADYVPRDMYVQQTAMILESLHRIESILTAHITQANQPPRGD